MTAQTERASGVRIVDDDHSVVCELGPAVWDDDERVWVYKVPDEHMKAFIDGGDLHITIDVLPAGTQIAFQGADAAESEGL